VIDHALDGAKALIGADVGGRALGELHCFWAQADGNFGASVGLSAGHDGSERAFNAKHAIDAVGDVPLDQVRPAYETGDVDVIEYVPWQNMTAIENNPALTLQETSGPFMYLVFNMTSGPFQDAKLRQAVAHAINREDVVAGAFFGRGGVLECLPIDPNSPYYDPSFANMWNYDPDYAKQLMKEAGVEGGFNTTMLSTSSPNMHKDTAEIVQQHLAAIGINVNLRLAEWGARTELGNKGQYDFAVNGGGLDSPDPDGLTSILGTAGPSYRRSFGLSDSVIDEILARARTVSSVEERTRLLIGVPGKPHDGGIQYAVSGGYLGGDPCRSRPHFSFPFRDLLRRRPSHPLAIRNGQQRLIQVKENGDGSSLMRAWLRS